MENPKPHAIVVPMPTQGHLNPMMKLAKVLHSRGFYISFVNTEIVQRLSLRFQGATVLDGSSSTFRFLTIPNELNYENDEYVADPPVWIKAIKSNLVAPFRDLVSRLNEASGSDGFPPISCIVSDSYMTFTLDVAEEFGIPSALLFPVNACSAIAYAHLRQLIEKGLVPPKDANFLTNGFLDTVINWIPGMKGIQLKYMPSYIRTTDPDDAFIHFTIDEMERAHKATVIVINTFDIESKIIGELKCIYPQVSTIGPLYLLENQLPQNEVNFYRPTLFKEDGGYLKWLDTKEPASVVLVAFGTTSYITADQLMEFAWGLANSKQNFLWIIRPDLVVGEAAVIPHEFEMEIKDRGLIASWCNQESVLKHPAVGGFLTHCGWNSVLESICAGVPMIFWPSFADQLVNCWFCCNHFGIGLELDSEVNRDNVESLVRELMIGEKGKEIKEKVMEWKILAEETCSTGGSSYENFEKMVEVLQSKPHLRH